MSFNRYTQLLRIFMFRVGHDHGTGRNSPNLEARARVPQSNECKGPIFL
jgi:hypothetical protein